MTVAALGVAVVLLVLSLAALLDAVCRWEK